MVCILIYLETCTGVNCSTGTSNLCRNGICKCGVSPPCNPRGSEANCLAADYSKPLTNDTTATCKTGGK